MLAAAACAVLFVAGIELIWSGLQPGAPVVRIARRPDALPIAGGVGAGAAVFGLSGWPIPSLVVAGLTAWGLQRARHPRRAGDTERVEALATWVESVRDVLQAAGQPIGAIGATVDTCPVEIRASVRTLFARLSAGQNANVAFRRLADEIDDPLADLVATGLLIAVTRGAQTERVLSALATQARHQADRRRVVEAERAPMRHQVLVVSLIMCALLGGVLVFARSSYLDAYDTVGGQVFLGIILVGYAALLARVAALSRYPGPSRFLTLASTVRGAER